MRRLPGERRVSPLTLDAYARDLRQFIGFLVARLDAQTQHGGVERLKPGDLRAFMARRREEGVGSRSLLRQLAGLAVLRALSGPREGLAQIDVFDKVRTPKARACCPRR